MSEIQQPSETDAALLQRAEREPSAFGELFDRHAKQVNRRFRSRTDSADTANDLTAETFTRVWKARRRFKPPEDGRAGPWIQGIAANVHRSWAEHQRVERATLARLGAGRSSHDSESDALIERLACEATVPTIDHALGTLPERQREAIKLRVIDRFHYDEIGQKIGCTPDTARMRVMRGLRALRTVLKGDIR